jgi:hypothetical protein
MDIYEAIDALERIYDSNVPMMDDEEATMFAEALESVWKFAQKYEPHKEPLRETFTCTCGEHLVRNCIVEDSAQFICTKCNSTWYIGRPF